MGAIYDLISNLSEQRSVSVGYCFSATDAVQKQGMMPLLTSSFVL